MSEKAIVLMSGGLDSTTCLYWAKNKYDEVYAITFNYFHRINGEKIATRKITRLLGVRLIEVQLPFIKEQSEYSNFEERSADQPAHSYIPLRNLIFYSISGYFAQVNKIQNIVGGHNAGDGKIFKDATGSYFKRMNQLIKQGLLDSADCNILLPLKEKSRVDVIRLGLKLRIPFGLTWSCHRAGRVHCGNCYACKQRLDAFKILRRSDSIDYEGNVNMFNKS
ncbi:MAG TPA: 7-cyano-7-deazaguanine synthase [Nitrososphaeraceae archaeon]|jgi:7-cyano-7-deazaguanine synthase